MKGYKTIEQFTLKDCYLYLRIHHDNDSRECSLVKSKYNLLFQLEQEREESEYQACKTQKDFCDFVRKYSLMASYYESRRIKDAQEEIKKQEEESFWNEKKSTYRGCEMYLKKYPEGRYKWDAMAYRVGYWNDRTRNMWVPILLTVAAIALICVLGNYLAPYLVWFFGRDYSIKAVCEQLVIVGISAFVISFIVYLGIKINHVNLIKKEYRAEFKEMSDGDKFVFKFRLYHFVPKTIIPLLFAFFFCYMSIMVEGWEYSYTMRWGDCLIDYLFNDIYSKFGVEKNGENGKYYKELPRPDLYAIEKDGKSMIALLQWEQAQSLKEEWEEKKYRDSIDCEKVRYIMTKVLILDGKGDLQKVLTPNEVISCDKDGYFVYKGEEFPSNFHDYDAEVYMKNYVNTNYLRNQDYVIPENKINEKVRFLDLKGLIDSHVY